MIRFLLGLSPAVLSIVMALAGSGITLTGAKLWNDWIDNPGIVREQRAICLSQVEAAAAKATRDEQLRQFRAGEAATEQFILESQEAADDQQAVRDMLEMEIERYEQALEKSGKHQCRIDADDFGVLGLQLDQPSTSTGRQ
jgi:hypothetical protein